MLWLSDQDNQGNGVVASVSDRVYTAANDPTAVSHEYKQMIDLGTQLLATVGEATPLRPIGDRGWRLVDSTEVQRGQRVRIKADACGDLYIPWVPRDITSTRTIRRYFFEGTGSDGPLNHWTYDLGDGAYVVDMEPAGVQVDERNILDSSGDPGPCAPEFLYVASIDDLPTSANPTYQARRLEVLGRQLTGSEAPRQNTLLAVTENGNVAKYGSTGWSSVATAALPAPYVWSATLFQKTFLGNGSTYRVYDHTNETLRAFEEATTGKIPPRCRLGASWRGRLVLARGDDAHNWHMSAFADPFDWDVSPDVVTETQAVSGNSSQVGEVPDLVNALVPWSDDLLIFGGDSSIWRLTGDPMTSGELHRVSDITGMAYGPSWCKDEEQRIYFWGSRGGLYTMTPDGSVQPLSENRVHRRLKDIDLGQWRPTLTWNDLDQCVHAFLVPLTGTGEPRHYCWERRTGAFWEDQFHGSERQVRGVFLADGDAPQDRRLYLGCADGRIRVWDPTAEDDDGTAIRSSCLIGPIAPDTAPGEYRVTAVEPVLAKDQGGCLVGIGATDTADFPGYSTDFRQIDPGRNGHVRMRARGSNIWVEFAANDVGSTWAVEDLAIHLSAAGRKRVRR